MQKSNAIFWVRRSLLIQEGMKEIHGVEFIAAE